LALVVGVAALPACGGRAALRSAPPPEPLAASSAAVGVALALVAPGGERSAPETVWFVRLPEGQPDAAILAARDPIPSNHRDGERFYVLNAEPGTWVAVATSQEKAIPGLAGRVRPTASSGTLGDSLRTGFGIALGESEKLTHRTYLTRQAIDCTRARVEAGGFAFLGDLVVQPEARSEDEVQAHFRQVLEGDPALRVGRSTRAQSWSGTLLDCRREADAERAFFTATETAFGRSAWAERAAARLRALP
jgi:hypothetical protein